MRRRTWMIWTGAAVALCVAAAVGFHTTADVAVTTDEVTAGPILRHVVATGTLQAVTTVDVGAQVSGIVQSLSADYNSLVRAGDVVARLDPSSYDAQLREAQAALSQAQADLSGFTTAVEDTQTKLTRARELSAGQLIPASDLDDARIAADTANAGVAGGRSAVARAQAAVHEASINLDHTIIRSPIDGVVVARNVDAGQTVAASLQAPVLFTIAADLRRMQVQVTVDESDVGGLRTGEPAAFTVESYPNETFHGTVSEIRLQPIVEQTNGATASLSATTSVATGSAGAVVTYMTIVDVSNSDERLRPGMTATVVLDGQSRPDAIRIPNRALSFRPAPDVLKAVGEAEDGDRSSQVWTYDGKQFTRVDVRTGLADDGWTELVGDTLRSGEPVVTAALLRRRSLISRLAGEAP